MTKYLSVCLVLLFGAFSPVYAQWQVVVFPYENESSDGEFDWFGRAITETLIHAYYRVPQIRVIDEDILQGTLGDRWVDVIDDPKLADHAWIHIVLRGHYAVDDGRVIVATDIVEAPTGKIRRSVLGESRVEDPLLSLHPLIGTLADTLKISLNEDQKKTLLRPVIDSPDMLKKTIDAIQVFRQGLKASDHVLLAQAERSFKEVVGKTSESALPHLYLGRLYEAMRQTDLAEAAYRDAIEMDAQHVEAHYRLGAMLYELGRKTDALAELEQAIRLSPIDPIIQKKMAEIFFSQTNQ